MLNSFKNELNGLLFAVRGITYVLLRSYDRCLEGRTLCTGTFVLSGSFLSAFKKVRFLKFYKNGSKRCRCTETSK